MSKEWTVQGYSFPTKSEYEKAKKEQESIAYIRAKSELTNPKKVLQLYQNLVEKDMFETIIGYTFMENLRRYLITKEIVPEEMIPPVKVKLSEVERTIKAQKTDTTDYKKQYEQLVEKRSISKYINIGLIMIVAAMFAITYFSPKNNQEVAQSKIEDEYASWKERLQEKEEQLLEREAALMEQEAAVQK